MTAVSWRPLCLGIVLYLAAHVNAQLPNVENRTTHDPTIASPAIRNRLDPPDIAANTTRRSTIEQSPTMSLLAIVMSSSDSGTAIIKTESSQVTIALRRSRLQARPSGSATNGDVSSSRLDAPMTIDLTTSFSSGGELYRVIDFENDALLIEHLSSQRYVIVR